MIKDFKTKELLKSVSEKNETTQEEAELCIDSMYMFIRSTIQSIPFKEMKSLEEFRNTKKNFNIPALGKLYTIENMFVKINNIEDECK